VLAPDVATVPQRFVARVIDGLVLMVPMLVVIAVSGITTAYAALLLAVAVEALYEIPQLAARGATVGKRVMRLRVITHDGSPPSFGQAFVRVILPNVFAVSPAIALQDFGSLWGLAVYAAVFFDPWRRGLHDRAAGTRVVREVGSVAG
jgi:uncharacterized RDD family membrane protein YckC